MAGRFNFPENQKVRREEAAQRAAEREKRGDAGQLKRLEQRGFGECREAKRLRQKLQAS
jgi:hypothetical protein